MSKCLVVGGAGFIGSHVVDALIDAKHDVWVVDNLFLGKRENVINCPPSEFFRGFYAIDASDYTAMKVLVRSIRPDVVYNLAVMPLPHSLCYPKENVDVNINIITNLLEMQGNLCFERLIHFSSSEVYGSAVYTPMTEEHPLEAITPYAASKAACDLICLSYFKTFDNDVTILRPFNNYGPRQNEGSYAGLIPLTINRILKGDPIKIYGDGNQTRDYIYVEDTARAAVIALGFGNLAGQVINIASGIAISVNEIVEAIKGLMADRIIPPCEYEDERPGDVRCHLASVVKSQSLLKFKPMCLLEDGLKETIKFYAEKNKKSL